MTDNELSELFLEIAFKIYMEDSKEGIRSSDSIGSTYMETAALYPNWEQTNSK